MYVYYTHVGAGSSRRLRQPGQSVHDESDRRIDPASEVVLLDNISSVGGNHNGGDLDIGSDGFLYVSVGDAGHDPRGDARTNDAAQDLSLLNGKILRITLRRASGARQPDDRRRHGAVRDASATRPSTPSTQCQEIFAWGLRNPYRFAFDRNDGCDRFFINDVGQSTSKRSTWASSAPTTAGPSARVRAPAATAPPCPRPAAGPASPQPLTDYGRERRHGHHRRRVRARTGSGRPSTTAPTSSPTPAPATSGSGSPTARSTTAPRSPPVSAGISDMTFGFDADGRMVLYYVEIGGGLRKITPTTPAASSARNDLRMIPVTPFRAYDTGLRGTAPVGVAAGDVFNGTTRPHRPRRPRRRTEAALVNITYADNTGNGFVTVCGARAACDRSTSSLNADAAGTVGANTAIVPLDDAGSFVLESTITGRVIVDVMAWFDDDGGRRHRRPLRRAAATAPRRHAHPGRDHARVGQRQPVHPSGRRRSSSRSTGRLGVPVDGTASAVVLSIGAIAGPVSAASSAPIPTGRRGATPRTSTCCRGDVRANMVVVPLGTDGRVSLTHAQRSRRRRRRARLRDLADRRRRRRPGCTRRSSRSGSSTHARASGSPTLAGGTVASAIGSRQRGDLGRGAEHDVTQPVAPGLGGDVPRAAAHRRWCRRSTSRPPTRHGRRWRSRRCRRRAGQLPARSCRPISSSTWSGRSRPDIRGDPIAHLRFSVGT